MDDNKRFQPILAIKIGGTLQNSVILVYESISNFLTRSKTNGVLDLIL